MHKIPANRHKIHRGETPWFPSVTETASPGPGAGLVRLGRRAWRAPSAARTRKARGPRSVAARSPVPPARARAPSRPSGRSPSAFRRARRWESPPRRPPLPPPPAIWPEPAPVPWPERHLESVARARGPDGVAPGASRGHLLRPVPAKLPGQHLDNRHATRIDSRHLVDIGGGDEALAGGAQELGQEVAAGGVEL